VFIGYLTIQPMLFGDFFKDAIATDIARHPAMQELASHFHSAAGMAAHSLQTVPLWLAVAGVATAWWFYLKQPSIPAAIKAKVEPLYKLLDNKYYMDWINEHVFAAGARLLGTGLWKGGDVGVIDGVLVNGSARAVGAVAQLTRLLQTGYLYIYALVMLLGIFVLMTWQLWPQVRRLFGL
jgi:NADH-quinone oxidoreductase subunit L